MVESVKKIKQVCKCENCGNEAEMVVTCTLQVPEAEGQTKEAEAARHRHETRQRVKGTGTCSRCGNEADMWVDI
jgi:DNA-directed RNA polymerase subunit M/transcription elongation factor TFIIS